MLFNSYVFIFLFLPVVALGFAALKQKYPNLLTLWLLVSSFFFYGWWDLNGLWLLTTCAAINFGIAYAIKILSSDNKHLAKAALLSGLTFNISVLAYYKYWQFFLSIFDPSIAYSSTESALHLPLGISFYTFTQIAFLVDIYAGKTERSNLVNYPLFVSYFPHLLAGPILNHRQMVPQFSALGRSRISNEILAAALCIFSIGLFKKTVIADNLAPIADRLFALPPEAHITSVTAWLGALAYSMQIYFDFSAYSDMAFGVSMVFGIRMPINFRSPYQSASIVEFWRRWHISLSNFLRDYLYIKLGGNRKGPAKRYINLFITMLLGGLWHGAGWQFIIWGALHGGFLTICHIWQSLTNSLSIKKSHFWNFLGTLTTFVCVTFAWIFFRANDVPQALRVIEGLFKFDQFAADFKFAWSNSSALSDVITLTAASLIVFFCPNIYEILNRRSTTPSESFSLSEFIPTRSFKIGHAIALGFILFIAVTHITKESKFLYFQF